MQFLVKKAYMWFSIISIRKDEFGFVTIYSVWFTKTERVTDSFNIYTIFIKNSIFFENIHKINKFAFVLVMFYSVWF